MSAKHHFSLSACFFLLIAVSDMQAQPFFWFKRQSQVDSVQILYPGIEELGGLVIGYIPWDTAHTDIHDLTPLLTVKKIWGEVYIRHNPHLKNLHGLDSLERAQYGYEFTIEENDSLESLQGLNNLKYVEGGLLVLNNPLLQSTAGLERLEYVREGIQVSGNGLTDILLPSLRKTNNITIHNEPYLTSLEGLESLDTLGIEGLLGSALLLYSNPQLVTLSGLEGITFINVPNISIANNASLIDAGTLTTWQADTLGAVRIDNNDMIQEVYFPQVKKLWSIEINDNASLHSITFPNLEQCWDSPASWGLVEIMGNASLTEVFFPKLKFTGYTNNDNYSLRIMENALLESPGNFGSLEQVGGHLEIEGNPSMKSLAGLEKLKSTGGDFSIAGNGKLETLCDFTQFDSIGSDLVISNDSLLTSLHGLDSLRFVGLRAFFGGIPSLTDVNSLCGIDSLGWNFIPFELGGIGFSQCNSLQKIDFTGCKTKLPLKSYFGFGNCVSLDSVIIPYIEDIELFLINDNFSLKYMSFPSIRRMGGEEPDLYYYSFIRNNPSLTSLDGISTIMTLEFPDDSLVIRNNPLLTDCSAICLMLDRGIPGGRFKLSGNAFPCNSVAEIEEHICDTLTAVTDPRLPEKETSSLLLTMPNPTEGLFRVALPDGAEAASLRVYGVAGHQPAFTAGPDGVYDVRQLPAGVYFVIVTDRQGRQYRGRVVRR